MSLFSWLRRKVIPTRPEPMPVIPGEEYVMDLRNPFEPPVRVRVDAVRDGWVRYYFVDAPSSPNHTTISWFRNAYHAAPTEAPCATCNDDPAECAKVPGLRHCEKALRGAAPRNSDG